MSQLVLGNILDVCGSAVVINVLGNFPVVVKNADLSFTNLISVKDCTLGKDWGICN